MASNHNEKVREWDYMKKEGQTQGLPLQSIYYLKPRGDHVILNKTEYIMIKIL